MPNRILKESICTSDNLNELSEEEENFFYRLLVCCDDFGRFDGRPAIIKARCYPLRDKPLSTIEGYLSALADKDVILLYRVEGKDYIQMQTWDKHQQVRAKKSKFPAPACDLISDDIDCDQLLEDVPVIQSESNPNPIRIPYEELRMSFNKFCPSFPNATIITPLRHDAIKRLWLRYEHNDGGAVLFFDNLFKKAEASDFLTGRTGKGKWCNFDWILDKDHPIKIVEGHYDNRAQEIIGGSDKSSADVFDALKGVR